MKKKAFYFDHKKFNDFKKNLEFVLPILHEIFIEFNRITPKGKKASLKQIQDCITPNRERHPIPGEIEEIIFNMFLDSSDAKLFGQPIKKERARELIVMPDMKALIEAMEKIKDYIPWFADNVYWDFYEIVEDKVEISKSKLTEFHKGCHEYIETEDQQYRLVAAQMVIDGINEFRKMVTVANPEDLKITGYIVWDQYELKYRANTFFIKSGEKAANNFFIGVVGKPATDLKSKPAIDSNQEKAIAASMNSNK